MVNNLIPSDNAQLNELKAPLAGYLSDLADLSSQEIRDQLSLLQTALADNAQDIANGVVTFAEIFVIR